MAKWVYTFGDGKAEGRGTMRELLGGKGAGLAEMAGLGLPVPPGFTITTEVCTYFYAHAKKYPDELAGEIDAALAHIGKLTGRAMGERLAGSLAMALLGLLGGATILRVHEVKETRDVIAVWEAVKAA